MAGKVLGIDGNGDTIAADAIVFSGGEFDNGNETGTFALDWNAGQKQRATLTGNITTLNITDLDVTGVANLTLKIIQGGAGSFTVTWPAGVLWAGGTAPTLSTGVGDVDIVTFYWDGTNYYGAALLNFS